MYYYYDIMLNFCDNVLYEFYEWENNDNMDFVKKIPLFRVSTNVLKDQLKYKTKFDLELVKQIKNKTILKSNSRVLENTFVISDSKNALALELDNDGLVISRSKLLLSDEINLCEIMFTMKEEKLSYEKLELYSKKEDIRQVERIKKLIKCEVETLYQKHNYSKLKYLYYEWFNKSCDNINVIIKEINVVLNGSYDEKIDAIYELIKMSYNKVN